MVIVYSKNRVPIRLTAERWGHVVTYHPEMVGQREAILETVGEPDLVQRGDYGAFLAARLYTDTALGEKYLVVAYRETTSEDGFILTAYYTRRLSTQRETVWKR